jgi:hypothetical protein
MCHRARLKTNAPTSTITKVRFGETPKSARGARALPSNHVVVLDEPISLGKAWSAVPTDGQHATICNPLDFCLTG